MMELVTDQAARVKAQRELASQASALPPEAPVTMPAGLLASTLADLEEAREARSQLAAYKARVSELEERPRLVLVGGGEEDHGTRGGE